MEVLAFNFLSYGLSAKVLPDIDDFPDPFIKEKLNRVRIINDKENLADDLVNCRAM